MGEKWICVSKLACRGIHLTHGGNPFIIHGYLVGTGLLDTGDTGETYSYDDEKVTGGQSKVNFVPAGIGWVDLC